MGILRFLKHRTTRIVIEAIFLTMSAVGLFNTIANNCVDEVFVFIVLFAIANTLHLIFDKLWSWLCVMPFILVYVVFLWINFLSYEHVYYELKYTMEDYIYFGIFTAGISIVLLFIIYLLKPSAKKSTKESSKEGIALRRVFYALGGLAVLNIVFHIANFCYIAFGGHGGGAGYEAYIIGTLTALLLFLVYGILLLAFRSKIKSQSFKSMRLIHATCIANVVLYLAMWTYVLIFEMQW